MDKEKCPLCELGLNAWNVEEDENEYDDVFGFLGVNIENGKLYFDNSAGEYNRDFVLINYCPMCGRKL